MNIYKNIVVSLLVCGALCQQISPMEPCKKRQLDGPCNQQGAEKKLKFDPIVIIQQDIMNGALIHAVIAANVERVAILLEGGAQPQVTDINGRTALHYSESNVGFDDNSLDFEACVTIHNLLLNSIAAKI